MALRLGERNYFPCYLFTANWSVDYLQRWHYD